MTRKIFVFGTLLVVMLMLAACGTAAKPAYDAENIVAQAQETVTANAEQVAAATEEVTAEVTEVATEEVTAEATEVATEEATTEVTEVATEEATMEATEVATEEATMDVSAQASGGIAVEDDPLFEAVSAADATTGEQLFLTNGCVGCHSVDPSGITIVGPDQWNLIERAGERVAGEGPYTYIYNSIVHPNDYIVEGFTAGIMPQNFGDLLTDEQIYDIIAYFATLHD